MPRFSTLCPLFILLLSLAGCGSLATYSDIHTSESLAQRSVDPQAQEAVLFALGLLDTDYRFGGRNPEAGLDCSGMVIYVYNHVAGFNLSGSAADIAQKAQPVPLHQLIPGDLVFFNTSGRSFSHVGLYIGENRFIHAPSSKGKVRIDRLDQGYFKDRFESARTLF
jgi:cell wall-associated NlpC family hydrolase